MLTSQKFIESDGAGSVSYIFIDNVRFFSMIAIVMRHCERSLFSDLHVSSLERSITQFRGFGVLMFFVNSAFLMAAWLARPNSSIRTYWWGRLNRVGKPWLIWASVYQIIELTKFFVRQETNLSELTYQIWQNVFFDVYWFVPILLFSLAVFLPLRCLWRSWWFGLILFLLSLIYGVDQYSRWFPPSHTTAFFGYLFYLWLGVQLFEHFPKVQTWVWRIQWRLVLTILCLGFGLMIVENKVMLFFGFPNTYNALQISNQFYALVALIVLIKLNVKLVPSFMNVRKETYGIYLIHQIIGSVGRGGIDVAVGLPKSGASFFARLPEMIQNPFARIGVWVFWFGVVYTTSVLATKALRHTNWAWIVGEKN
jgi:peptidoglycan/LPS O-acetylase OafA/YrhL